MLMVDDKNCNCQMDSSYFPLSFIMKNLQHKNWKTTFYTHYLGLITIIIFHTYII